jgi:hypothetical protein
MNLPAEGLADSRRTSKRTFGLVAAAQSQHSGQEAGL